MLHAAAFIDVVKGDERRKYEREQGFPITEKNAEGNLVPAKPQPVYYPLTYRASKREAFTAQSVGFNLGSDPTRLSLPRGGPRATAKRPRRR